MTTRGTTKSAVSRGLGTLGALAALATAGIAGCSDGEWAQRSSSSPILYGADDRRELYESDAATQGLASRVVAFVDRSALAEGTPYATWKDRAGLCSSERFSDQPSLAFCTGVLLDDQTLLTAAHCVEDAVSFCQTTVLLRGYWYQGEGSLAAEPGASTVACEGVEARSYTLTRDLALIRVRADGPLGPLALAPLLQAGDGITALAASGGVPLKETQGRVIAGSTSGEGLLEYVADLYGGASGAPIFSSDGALAAVNLRGGEDFSYTEGCAASRVVSDGGDEVTEAGHASWVLREFVCKYQPTFAWCEVAPIAGGQGGAAATESGGGASSTGGAGGGAGASAGGSDGNGPVPEASVDPGEKGLVAPSPQPQGTPSCAFSSGDSAFQSPWFPLLAGLFLSLGFARRRCHAKAH